MSDYTISDWRKLGAVLRDKRRQRGLTQAQLAGLAGVSRAWLTKLEAGGHRRAEIEHVLRLLAALDVDMLLRDAHDDDVRVSKVPGDLSVGPDDEVTGPDQQTRIGGSRTRRLVPSRSELDAMRARSAEADDRMRAARTALADARQARDVVERNQRLIEEVRKKI